MDLDKEEITLTDIENHVAKHGRKATATLMTILGKKRPYYDAVMSGDGQLLLRSVIARMDNLLDRIVIGKYEETERMEYDILSRLMNEWAKELDTYQTTSRKLRGE